MLGALSKGRACALAVVVTIGFIAGCQSAGQRPAGEYRADQEGAYNMRLVSHNDLQARSAYQPVIHQQGDRWIAYIGHHGGERINPVNGQKEYNGTSIVDVTDPKNPKYLVHVPGAPGGPGWLPHPGLPQIRTCGLPHPAPRVTGLLRNAPARDERRDGGGGSALADVESAPTPFWLCESGDPATSAKAAEPRTENGTTPPSCLRSRSSCYAHVVFARAVRVAKPPADDGPTETMRRPVSAPG